MNPSTSSEKDSGGYLVVSTPIEVHYSNRRRVYVKRDDLCCAPPAPPLGKLRGLDLVLRRLVKQGARTVACWDTRVSKLGQGLALFVQHYPGVRAIVCYPHLKNGLIPESIQRAAELGAEVVPMRGNHVSICFAQATALMTRRGATMIPFGLDCEESVTAISAEARRVPHQMLKNGTVVVSCGSGVTVSGLIRGFEPMPKQIIAVSSGRSVQRLRACVKRYVKEIPLNLVIVPARIPYDSVPNQACPFPAHPNYDLKAWKFLFESLPRVKAPLLFWNIGA